MDENKNWKGSSRGGNAWAEITRSIIELRDALNDGDSSRASELVETIPTMWHNTGRLADKLRRLDGSLKA
jgi:hypothetical protein